MGRLPAGILCLIAAALLSIPAFGAGVFRYRKQILVDHTQVIGSADLTGFPVLVSLIDSDLRTVGSGGHVESASGFDIVFRAPGGTTLDHEVETYDGTTGRLIVWVRVPTLQTARNTAFYVYYGNPLIASSQENPTGVWGTSYRAVWHLKESPTAGAPQFLDSTANPNDGTASALGAGHQVAGQIDGSLVFDDGSARHVNVPHHASLQLATTMTVSAWVRKADCSGDVGVVVNKWGPGADKNYWLGKENATDLVFNVDISQKVVAPLAPLCDAQWHHIQGVADASAGLVRLFVDGTQRNTAPYDGLSNTGSWVLQIGKSSDVGGQEWNGGIDEVRVLSSALSADWIQTEFSNQSSPSTFYTVGPEQDLVNLPPLESRPSGLTFIVTAPDRFELVFDARYGGGVEKFYDLNLDPDRTADLSGGGLLTGTKTLLKTGILSSGLWYHPDDNSANTADPDGRWSGSPPRLDVLEATSTRVKVRQEAFYQLLCETPPCAPTVLAGLKTFADYSIYPSGKLSHRLQRRNFSSSAVSVSDQDLALGVRTECPGLGAACTDLEAYSDAGPIAGPGPGGSDFLLARREVAGRTTDFLRVFYQDWALADRTEYDTTVAFLTWRDQPTTGSIPAGANEIWNSLLYFKPTSFIDHADSAVTRRSVDYRLPDDPAVTVGTGWIDDAENTAGADLFNEAEATYLFDLDPAAGLVFDLDGPPTTRHSPFFKIRRWRSLSPPATVTLEGATLNLGTDYRADVKPVARAHFAQEIRFYSTLESSSAVSFPNVGSGGAGNGGLTYVAARFGLGGLFDAASKNVTFPSTNNFTQNQGGVSFWYQPGYAHTDGVRHVLWENLGDANHFFLLEKLQSGGGGNNAFRFTIRNGPGAGSLTAVTVAATDYSWRAGDWVHVRVTWRAGGALGDQVRIFLNGVEPPHTDPSNPYDFGTMVVGTNYLGSDSGATSSASGIVDELYVYSDPSAPTALARGGLVGAPDEYLADGVAGGNFALPFAAVDSAVTRRAEYFYAGADSKFRGLNVALDTAGSGVAPVLRWQLWNGTDWTNVTLLTDQTSQLTRDGTLYWDMDLSGWQPYSPDGGPELYYVRAYLESGSYSTPPVEGIVKTDILLFQYAGDITASAQTFDFSAPQPTSVELVSLEAHPLDRAVALSWRTASELDNLGFHVHRATAEEGPYERVTPRPIPGLGSSVAGALYHYRDEPLENGITYFYKLEDLETSGRTEQHGPMSATPMAGALEPPPPDGEPPRADAVITYGDPSQNELRIREEGPGEQILELATNGFHAEPLEDGTVRIRIPGLEALGEEGSPSVPVKRVSLRALAGRKVELISSSAEGVEWIEGLVPEGTAAARIEAGSGGTVRLSSNARRMRASGEASLYPDKDAEIASIAFQGDEKKVLVQLAPLRWDSRTGRLVLSRRLVVRVSFRGREPLERVVSGGGGRRSRLGPDRHRNEPSPPVRRLATVSSGLHGVRFEELFGARGSSLKASGLRLSRRGRAVAFHIEPDPLRFTPGSTLYFLSGGAGENPHGAESIYELAIGARGERMEVSSGAPSGPRSRFYRETLAREEDRYYQAALVEMADPWLWDLLFAPATKSYSFAVSDLYLPSEPGRLMVQLQGTSDFPASPDHHLRLRVNGVDVAEESWNGKTAAAMEAELAPGVLKEGDNLLEIVNLGDTGAPYSMVMLDRFEVTYPRRARAIAGKLEGIWPEAGAAEVSGVEDALVVELAAGGPRWLRGALETEGGLRFRVESGGRYLVASAGEVFRPEVRSVAPSRWKNATRGADYLLIGPRAFLASAEPLVELRRSEGLRVVSVPVEELYSEFGFGESTPEAIRDFLSHAYHQWRPPSPRYILLLGDATYDFKDHLKTGVQSLVPPWMVKTPYLWTASDPLYAAVNGDDVLPDLAIGRIPAASVEEAKRMVAKIVAYETDPERRASEIVIVADDADEAGDFESNAEDLASGVLASRSLRRIYLSRLGPSGVRESVVDAFDRGASIVSYIGHGGIQLWADENVFHTGDAARLSPQPRQPFLLTMNCLNGYFHFPYFDSLAEGLLKLPDKGAIAAFSPSGLSLNGPAHRYHEAVLREVTRGSHGRLGDALLAAQAAYADTGSMPELLVIYHLFGDPALRLR